MKINYGLTPKLSIHVQGSHFLPTISTTFSLESHPPPVQNKNVKFVIVMLPFLASFSYWSLLVPISRQQNSVADAQ